MSVYCLECGKKLVGDDLAWHHTNNEIIDTGGKIYDKNYCVCYACISDRLQSEFDETCDKILGRGGARPGAGRKPMKSGLKKQKKAFSLSPEAVQALADLQESFGLSSQSAVVEFLALRSKPRR